MSPRTTPRPAPTPPPEWVGRPGVIRGSHALHGSAAYAAAVALDLDLPPALTEAVAIASRANSVMIDVNDQVKAADDAFVRDLEAHARGEGSVPSIAAMALAGAAASIAERARDHVTRCAEASENASVAQVRLASAGWIVEAKPLFAELVDELMPSVEKIPPTVNDLPTAARTSREVLAAWQAVEDRLPRWRQLLDLRESLAHLTHPPIEARELIDSGRLIFRDPDAARRSLPKTGDAAGLVVAAVRARDVTGLGYLTDAELLDAAADLAAVRSVGRQALRAQTRGIEIVA